MSRAFVASILAVLAIISNTGCASGPPTPVSLHYALAERENVSTDLAGVTIGIVPFQDGRTDAYLYRRSLVLAEDQDAGVWIANAMKLEFEHAGATVEALPPGAPPSTGKQITGQVALLKADATGWHLGGILAALIGTGYKPHIALTVHLHEEGVPVYSRQYDLKKNVPSDPGHVLMWGFPPAQRDVPVAFGVVLKKLIREQIMPDLTDTLRDSSLSVTVESARE